MLIDQDGADWREKLPDIPLVPVSAQQHRREEPPSAEALKARAEREARDAGLWNARSRGIFKLRNINERVSCDQEVIS